VTDIKIINMRDNIYSEGGKQIKTAIAEREHQELSRLSAVAEKLLLQ
jgi:hypothetical protein